MRRALLIALWLAFFVFCSGPAFAQGNQCRTASVGASTGNCASEAFVTDSVGAGGNVRGPNSSTAGHIATFADTTGKLIQDGGVPATVTQVNTAGLATGGPITTSGTVTVTAASKSDQQAGASAVVAVTPAHQQDHDSAIKVHANFTGTGSPPTINESYGVTSVARGSAGSYTVTFSTNFASATGYGCTGSTEHNAANTFLKFGSGVNKAVNTIAVFVLNLAGSLTDPDAVSIECTGRQ